MNNSGGTMGDPTPVIEGPVKFRDGKKWKARFATVTRLSPVAGRNNSEEYAVYCVG